MFAISLASSRALFLFSAGIGCPSPGFLFRARPRIDERFAKMSLTSLRLSGLPVSL